jgi:hypothetical protein
MLVGHSDIHISLNQFFRSAQTGGEKEEIRREGCVIDTYISVKFFFFDYWLRQMEREVR